MIMNLSEENAKVFIADIGSLLDSQTAIGERFGNLFKLFYQIVKQLTQVERTVFRNFYARFKFLLANANFSEFERKELDAFRRFVKKAENSTLHEELFISALRMVLLIAEKVYGDEELDSLKNNIPDHTSVSFSALFPIRRYDTVNELKVMVYKWEGEDRHQEDRHFKLSAYDIENLEGEVTIIIRRHQYVDFTYLHSLLAENMILNFKNLSPISGLTKAFETSYHSLITIEPDFLVDATGVGECFNTSGVNSDSFFLGKLVSNLPGAAALKGSLVGYYLDEMIRNPNNFDSELVFKDGQKRNAMKAAQFGSQVMLQMKDEIETEQIAYVLGLVKINCGRKIWIEPTYFSKEYGLQGRIDLLSENPETGSKDIFELKSGSPSNPNFSTAWENHKMQVVCYDLALDSTYGSQRIGTHAVYYSKKSPNNPAPNRNIVSESREKAQALKIRNELVAKLYQLALRDYSTIERIQRSGIPNLPKYSETELKKFKSLYQPGTNASQYYQELVSFTLRELINAKVGGLYSADEERHENGFAGLWLNSLLAKENNYQILYNLKLEEVIEECALIKVSITKDLPHSFRKGDLVVFYPYGESNHDVLNYHILKGAIKDIQLNHLSVSLYNQQTDYSFIHEHEFWAIEPDIFERNYWSSISVLLNVLSCSEEKREILFGQREPVFDENAIDSHPSLTANQNEAVTNAFNAKDYYLLQGPPGTGKTSTFLVAYIREVLNRTTSKIVILAFTNKAVDKICESLREPRTGNPIPYLRFGSQFTKDEHKFSHYAHDGNPDLWRNIIEKHQVHVSTVATFQNRWLLLKEFIDYNQVVIDEASQLTEANLAGVLTLFDKFVLIGDQKQLPAVVTQAEKTCVVENSFLKSIGINDLRVSLFERLFSNAKEKGWSKATGQLTSHYRMHETIADLVAKHYSEALIAERPEQKTAIYYSIENDHPLDLLSERRIAFVETPPEAALKKNSQEAKVAALIVHALIDSKLVQSSEIGIITPFRAQIAQIKKFLRSALLETVSIDTVERYQGDERKIILFSTTIADPRQIRTLENISSTDEDQTDRKLLVSISRASEQFIMLGCSEALTASQEYDHVIHEIIGQGGYFGRAWTDEILNFENQNNAI